MYSNINSRWVGEFPVTGVTITANTTSLLEIDIPGVDPNTMLVDGVMFANESDLAKTGSAQPVIRGYIQAAGIVYVSVTAIINTITIADGAKVRVSISQNDNSWDSSGL